MMVMAGTGAGTMIVGAEAEVAGAGVGTGALQAGVPTPDPEPDGAEQLELELGWPPGQENKGIKVIKGKGMGRGGLGIRSFMAWGPLNLSISISWF